MLIRELNHANSDMRHFMTSKIKKMIHARNCAHSVNWWKKSNKLTGMDKSSNFSLTDLESQSIMNDKDTANYINSFFVGLTKDFPVVQDKWLMNNETESLPAVSRESVAKRLKELKTNKINHLV